ncbi:RHS repeat-associated core domain-containing protein [Paracidovorax citrulli]|uniref:Rhs family protein n=1 Tax=Paracidovorax citrulli (strain AAC00-1) TaxID=397945 RepID=A1TTQ1_PARC0|nr:Rhs family protein [Paracidovorax citrulli AAC00-1]ATG93819.1 hypothetical protein CQB05_07080 [Paracidovorax citrulli]UMT86274.1 RHS repeat-associated core domain-containing protein [Paracidovorax citrulli]
MRCAHRPACRGQRFALPTTQTFDHNYTASYYLHELRTPESYRGDNYSDAGGQRGGKASLFIYEPGSFVPLATVQGTQQPGDSRIYWYQCDQIGAPLELTDAQGHVAWAADYKVWGEAALRKVLKSATGTDALPGPRHKGHGPVLDEHDAYKNQLSHSVSPFLEQPFRFQGQQFDAETGLHYNRFRYYDPSIGRFFSQDPVGLHGGIHGFAYAPNPNNWIDPLGLSNKCYNCLPKCTDINAPHKPKTAEEMAAELSNQINKNSVTFSTPTKQGHIDLQGRTHYDKATETHIPTPHIQTRDINIGPNERITTSKKPKLPLQQQSKMSERLAGLPKRKVYADECTRSSKKTYKMEQRKIQ